MFDLVNKRKPPLLKSSTETPLDILKVKFRHLLREKLKIKYGRIPTNKKFADDFNSVSHYEFTITNETARKWISGVVIPRGPSMQILSQWLGISLQDTVQQNEQKFELDPQLTEFMVTFKNLSPARQKLLLQISNEFFLTETKNSKR